MVNNLFPIPIVIIIYNRPKETRAVWEVIKNIRPRKVYVIADGPKSVEDALLCSEARTQIVIDWPCKVTRYYAESNLGLRQRVVTGLNKVFQEEQSAIILEDDCVPQPTFFKFCESMLHKYASSGRLMSIAGFSANPTAKKIPESYYFSKYIESWGWATWRRAWEQYNDSMADWPEKKTNKWLNSILNSSFEVSYWTYIFDKMYLGKINSWAYRWLYSCWKSGGLTIVPKTSLITNIGYGKTATNTKILSSYNLEPSSAMNFPLNHPRVVRVNAKAGDITRKKMFINFPILVSLVIKEVLGNIIDYIRFRN